MSRALATFCALAVVAVCVSGVHAQRGSDLLEQYKNRTAVAAQQFENEIRDAIAQGGKIGATDPARAAEVLRAALVRVQADELLTPTRRESLTRDLKERIRVADLDGQRDTAKADEELRRKAQQTALKASQEREAAEKEKVAQLVNQVKALREQGRLVEANRLAAELADRYPDNPAVAGSARITGTADQIRENAKLLSQGDLNRMLALRDVDRSAIPPRGDIEFPPADVWQKLTKARKTTQALTPTEKKILQALNTLVSVDFKGEKFEEVMQWLSDKFDIPINLDKASLEQAMVQYDTPVKITATRFSTRTVLRKVLGDLGLTFVVKDQAIQVMTADRAKSLLTTRVYYIGDLVGVYDFNLPPAINQLQMAQSTSGLIDYIYRNVDPDGWSINERGGLGSIAFDPIRGVLVVKASAEMHYFLGSGLR